MSADQQRLQHIFKQLSPEQQQTLLEFAEFLHARVVQKPSPPAQIQPLPRPADESVIAAIKRLSQTYPMLDKAKMLDDTSTLMSQHVLQGRNKVAVIDELEALFLQHYETFIRENKT